MKKNKKKNIYSNYARTYTSNFIYEKPPIIISIIPISTNWLLKLFNLEIKSGWYSDTIGEIIFHKK